MHGDEDSGVKNAESTADKTERVRQTLLKAGYPLEMRVARAFHRSRFTHVAQGEVYRNDDGVFREIDVSAHMGVILHRARAIAVDGEDLDVTMVADVSVVCECKSNAAGNRPWIVFNDGISEDLTYRIWSHWGTVLGVELLQMRAGDSISDLSIFSTPAVVSYAATALLIDSGKTPRENGKDTAYEAVMQVLDAAQEKTISTSKRHKVFRVVIPLIVTSADLYSCSLDEKDELDLVSVDEAVLRVNRPGAGQVESVLVYIVRESKLPEFITRLEALHDCIQEAEDKLLGVLHLPHIDPVRGTTETRARRRKRRRLSPSSKRSG